MKVAQLIKDIKPIKIRGDLQIEINNIVYDSRKATDNSLFICVEGFKTDGHQYIKKAIEKGAKAILIEKELEDYQKNICYIQVKSSREAMSSLAQTFYDNPLKKIKLIGVTGTNGKTTTTYLVKGILEKSGLKTGLIGTINNIIGDKTLSASRTTPESLDLYQLFKEMLSTGINHVVMEVSSHALDLQRVKGMDFKIAVFTNISQDHLDYHQSLEKYIQVKSRLFQQLGKKDYGVINIDDNKSQSFINACQGEVITYGVKKEAMIKAKKIELSRSGVSFTVTGLVNIPQVRLKLTGLFNVYNSLAAIACAHILGLKDEQIKQGLEQIKGVAGRFELVKEGQDFAVVIDYAHTPDGMENVLTTALEFVKGRLILVFGCGGDRDREKRPLMAEIGVKYGDYCILTADNPRSEQVEAIIKDMEKGIKGMVNPKACYEVIIDRKEAIERALKKAKKNDMVIIFGKGHENYQIFKDKTIPFSDRKVASKILQSLVGDQK